MDGERAWAARPAGDLVIVYARSLNEAREKSGLTVEHFTYATERELEEWEQAIDGPLDERELKVLETMVLRRCRQIGRRRLLNRRRGRFVQNEDPASDSDMMVASRLVATAAKIGVLIAETTGGSE